MNRSGIKYGRLTALEDTGKRDKKRSAIWKFKCDCGTFVEKSCANIGRSTLSCGCLQDEARRNRKTNLTADQRKLRNTYNSMLQRCYNPTTNNYKWYGAKGITVCARWKKDFRNFYADMAPRPEGKTLDRINPSGNYCPSNCRWATPAEQTKNRNK